jgi:hypothetical protein
MCNNVCNLFEPYFDRNIHCRKEQISEYRLNNVLLLIFHTESEEEKTFLPLRLLPEV